MTLTNIHLIGSKSQEFPLVFFSNGASNTALTASITISEYSGPVSSQ